MHVVLHMTLEAALRLQEKGFAVILQRGKAAFQKGWNRKLQTPDDLRKDFDPDCNIGIVTGRLSAPAGKALIVVDIDVRDPNSKDLAMAELRTMISDRKPTTHTGGGGEHYWYLIPAKTLPKKDKVIIAQGAAIEGTSKPAWTIEVLLDGHACTVPPSIHPSGGQYRWANEEAHVEEAPAELIAAIERAAGISPTPERSDRDTEPPPRRTQASVIMELALDRAKLFHTPDNVSYAVIERESHAETWPVQSKTFQGWLTKLYYDETARAPNREALGSAVRTIAARAQFDGPTEPVFVRVAGHGNKTYIDLCDQAWRAIEIDAIGWRVVPLPPVRFIRAPGMLPLPEPQGGGLVTELRRFLNLPDDDSFVLAIAWMLAALRDRGPYPVMVLAGEQGSAKSTFATFVKALIDPNSAPLRALPKEDRDLFIAATNGHLLSFDNVSGIPSWMSDTLCRLATGGGFATRQLYTDGDEVLFDACRPVLMNGIEDFVNRPDLADRALFQMLSPIPETSRRPEADLRSEFEEARPRVLGALLDAMVVGIRTLPTIKLQRMPRMADFARWGSACEAAIGGATGSFMQAYEKNIASAVTNVVESDPVAAAVIGLMSTRLNWSGTPTELLRDLAEVAGDGQRDLKAWPKAPNTLSGRLRRAAPPLRKRGILIATDRTGQHRKFVLTRSEVETLGNGPSPSSSSSPSPISRDGRDDHDDRPPFVSAVTPANRESDAELF